MFSIKANDHDCWQLSIQGTQDSMEEAPRQTGEKEEAPESPKSTRYVSIDDHLSSHD